MTKTEWTEILRAIPPEDAATRAAAHEHWARLAKPLGGLGALETMIEDAAALTGNEKIDVGRRAVLVLCADNGVVAQGVSQTDQSVTRAVAENLAAHRTSVCRMADAVCCEVVPVDIGMAGEKVEGVLDRRILSGTADFTQGAAMTREQTLSAVEVGMNLVRDWKKMGFSLLATGEMGIGNTTTSSAVASVLLHQDVERVPIIMDGFISGVAALCAVRLCENAKKAVFASHVSSEPAAHLVLNALGKKPLLTAGMHLGEGTGAVASIPLWDMAIAVYQGCYSFSEGGIEPYKPQC